MGITSRTGFSLSVFVERAETKSGRLKPVLLEFVDPKNFQSEKFDWIGVYFTSYATTQLNCNHGSTGNFNGVFRGGAEGRQGGDARRNGQQRRHGGIFGRAKGREH